MRPIVAITQRQDHIEGRSEIRDCLDNAWFALFEKAELTPLILPNDVSLACSMIERFKPQGFLLTGGNDLSAYGGTCRERDQIETWILDKSIKDSTPVLGVCRGMQMIQHYFGDKLTPVKDHVKAEQDIYIEDELTRVNSYHNWATKSCTDGFICFAQALDGVIKGIRHQHFPIVGIMWHPERMTTFREQDIALFRGLFNK